MAVERGYGLAFFAFKTLESKRFSFSANIWRLRHDLNVRSKSQARSARHCGQSSPLHSSFDGRCDVAAPTCIPVEDRCSMALHASERTRRDTFDQQMRIMPHHFTVLHVPAQTVAFTNQISGVADSLEHEKEPFQGRFGKPRRATAVSGCLTLIMISNHVPAPAFRRAEPRARLRAASKEQA